MKRFIGLLLASATAVVAFASASQAHLKLDWDGNDTGSPLDIRYSAFDHSKRFYYGWITTDNTFRNPALGAKGNLFLDLDSRGDRRSDYYVWVDYRNGLKASVWKYNRARTEAFRVSWARAVRANRRSVVFRFPRSSIRRGGAYMRWYASSSYLRRVEYGVEKSTGGTIRPIEAWLTMPSRSDSR